MPWLIALALFGGFVAWKEGKIVIPGIKSPPVTLPPVGGIVQPPQSPTLGTPSSGMPPSQFALISGLPAQTVPLAGAPYVVVSLPAGAQWASGNTLAVNAGGTNTVDVSAGGPYTLLWTDGSGSQQTFQLTVTP